LSIEWFLGLFIEGKKLIITEKIMPDLQVLVWIGGF
jgi:hypothetical protein